ncbi:uncharacterized protein N7482_007796 [Penicillium canariense]|uniref:Uncharacterized protein n=1 Tax=Penicillium canariense TaxID=189055 RepID=A0A9W9HXF8_9EURO|nr:uncharacterized protein N7482_007796 [Penicillium canariense]KAJ5160792.1 hypothetical protein N7482_007796 [Penicillium canariense]
MDAPSLASLVKSWLTIALLVRLLQSPYLVLGLCVGLIVLLVSSLWEDPSDEILYGRWPLVGTKRLDLFNRKAKARFSEAACALLGDGFAVRRWMFGCGTISIHEPISHSRGKQGTAVFQVMATSSPLIVLHPKYVDEIKGHPYLEFETASKKVGRIIFPVVEDGVLKKTSLLKLKLLDSVMAQSQQVNPASISALNSRSHPPIPKHGYGIVTGPCLCTLHPHAPASMNRVATREILLSESAPSPRGAPIPVSAYIDDETILTPPHTMAFVSTRSGRSPATSTGTSW